MKSPFTGKELKKFSQLQLSSAIQHKWSYCNHCKTDIVLCGRCGNNTCNAGSGEIEVDGKLVKCPDCNSAYNLNINFKNQMNE